MSFAPATPAVSMELQAAPEVQSALATHARVASFAHTAKGNRRTIRRGPCSWIQSWLFAPS
ncbi:MAG: hypothetical protein ACKOCT_16965, partial [Alphaproteobacteria bacterium]